MLEGRFSVEIHHDQHGFGFDQKFCANNVEQKSSDILPEQRLDCADQQPHQSGFLHEPNITGREG